MILHKKGIEMKLLGGLLIFLVVVFIVVLIIIALSQKGLRVEIFDKLRYLG